jgi:uracil phosphoribosyltransferase
VPLQTLDHPLAHHLLTCLRNVETTPNDFRRHCQTLTTLLVLQSTYALRTRDIRVQTPIKETDGKALDQSLAAVPILRAGLGMLETVVQLFPDVAVGYIGLERDENTAIARRYYSKLPNLANRYTLCLDPMLATGGSASQAVTFLKEAGATKIVMVSIVSAPEGISVMQQTHPDVDIVTAAVDEGLNERRYIVPGLGDFGDRLYGTP